MNNQIHSVKYNFLMNFVLTASNFIFPLVTFPYISRVLGAAGNGKVNFAASVANYFMMVASLGIPTYGVKACAKVRDDKEELSQVAQEILIINLVTTILATITYGICLFTIPKLKMDKTLYLIEGINIILNMFGANWFYQALEQYDYITGRSIFFKFISVILMFIIVRGANDYRLFAATTVFASAGSNVVNFVRLKKYISFHRRKKYCFARHMKPILILFAQSAATMIYTNLDTVMLGVIKSDRDVGFYNAAVKVKYILVSLVSSFGNVLLPRMSYYVKGNQKKNFEHLLAEALNAVFFIAIPLSTYFLCEAKDCMLFLAGPEYKDAVITMQLINLAVLPIGLTTVIGIQTLTPLNREHQVLFSVLVGAFADFILNLMMIPTWGASGAAFATVVAEYLVLLVQMIMGRDIINSVWKNVHCLKYLGITGMAMIPLIVTEKWTSHLNIVIRLLATSGIFIVVVFFLLYAAKDELLMKILDNRIAGRLLK